MAKPRPHEGRGLTIQCMQIGLATYICGEDICPVAGIPRVRLDEERHKARPSDAQAFVISDEEATRKGSRQHVEGASDMHFAIKARAMIGRCHEPVIGWQRRGLRGEMTEVVEGDTDCPC